MIAQSRVKELFDYNPETGLFFRYKTATFLGNKPNGKDGYCRINVDGRMYLAHRLAWLFVYGFNPSKGIDHINGSKSDNKISNLREASQTENLQNYWKAKKDNLLGVKGVGFHKQTGKYRARIMICSKEIHLGLFETIEMASTAYFDAKRKYHPFWSGIGEEPTVIEGESVE